jgi:Leucine-rich repeat (LRR) protein
MQLHINSSTLFLLLLFIGWVDFVFLSSTEYAFPASELQALRDLYLSTNGSDWSWRTNNQSELVGQPWNFSTSQTNPCTQNWQGVTCSSQCTISPCNVTGLDLTAMNLCGELPTSINQLTELKILVFYRNFLNSTIPSSLGTLIHLTVLDLGSNLFSGTFPTQLTHLQNLSKLYLNLNLLQGSIPPQIGNLSKLTTLQLRGNSFMGKCPQELTLLNSTLIELDLSYNAFTGVIPAWFSDLTVLQFLSLTENWLVGTLPASLGKLSNLLILDVRMNEITGNIPIEFAQLAKIEELYFKNNSMNGTLADELFFGWPALITFNIFGNFLTGTIPSTIGALASIQTLTLGGNKFHGTIPSTIGLCSQLQVFNVLSNRLSGTIPESLFNIANLSTVVMSRNYFNGTISRNFAQLSQLRFLILGNNFFSGRIHSHLGNLTHLGMLTLDNNRLTGSIPRELSFLTRMRLLYLQYNLLTNTIPPELFTVKRAEVLYFFNNFLTGKLPQLNSNSSLIQLDVRYNLMSGSLTVDHFVAPQLQDFYASFNMLTGSLPEEFPLGLPLEQLIIQANFLEGTLPASLGNFLTMSTLFLQRNFFFGTLPISMTNSHRLLVVEAQENYFSGSLDPVLMGALQLRFFNVSVNAFSGTLSSALRNDLIYLRSFDVSSNALTGSIDYLFNTMPRLSELFLQNNYFTGHFDNMLNGTAQFQLTNIDISNNYLQGSIPSSFFVNCPHLVSFAAVKNCIAGSIPKQLCHCTSMRSLALDGLHTADVCKDEFFRAIPFINSYQLTNTLTGVVPGCLFNLSSLRTLHMSGNGITGSLPPGLSLGAHLSDLSLSHNLLTGSVPSNIQHHQWKNLDLSFNKFNGVLSTSFSSFPNDSALYLQVNRFSGWTPPSLINAQHVTILQGNMFNCDITGYSLPQNDPYIASFQCGSDSFDSSLIIWACSVGFFSTIIILCIAFFRQYNPKGLIAYWNDIVSWWTVFDLKDDRMPSTASSDSAAVSTDSVSPSGGLEAEGISLYSKALLSPKPSVSANSHSTVLLSILAKPSEHLIRNIIGYGKVMHDLRAVCRIITVLVIFIFLPVYISLNHSFSTYAEQYVWVVAFAYISGRVPAVAMFLLLLLYVTVIFVLFPRSLCDTNHSSANDANDKQDASSTDATTGSTWWSWRSRLESNDSLLSFTNSSKRFFQPVAPVTQKDGRIAREFWIRRIIVTILNCSVVLCVNIAYVYSTVVNVNKNWVNLLAFLLSLYKLTWSNIVLVEYIRKFCISPIRNAERELESGLFSSNPNQQPTRLFLKSLHKQSISYLFRLSVFNNVIAPFMAAALVSPYCFYYILATPPNESVSYQIFQCLSITAGVLRNSCSSFGYVSHSTSYDPPFDYSYQCSSALLQSFADVFMIRYIMVGVFVPVALIVLKSLQEFSFVSFVKTPQKTWKLKMFLMFTHSLPMLLRPLSTQGVVDGSMIDVNADLDLELIQMPPLERDSQRLTVTTNAIHGQRSILDLINETITDDSLNDIDFQDELVEMTKLSTELTTNKRRSSLQLAKGLVLFEFSKRRVSKYNHLFHKERVLVALVGDVAVLMTFGTIFPPIALVICLTIIVNSVVTQLMIGRFVTIAFSKEQNYLQPIVKFIDSECKDIGKLLAGALPTMSVLASSFWAFALFDCLGDNVGLYRALWIAIVVTLMPLWLYGLFLLLKSVGIFNREDIQMKFEKLINGAFRTYSTVKTKLLKTWSTTNT